MLLHYKCTSAVLMSAMLHRAAHVLNTCRNQIPKETVHWTGACRVCAPNIAHYLLLRKKLKCIVTVIGSFKYLSESASLLKCIIFLIYVIQTSQLHKKYNLSSFLNVLFASKYPVSCLCETELLVIVLSCLFMSSISNDQLWIAA